MTSPDPLALPAFVISIIGLCVASLAAIVSTVSLIWQIVVRTRGAHRVIAEATSGMMLIDHTGKTGPYLQITARNRGAAAVTVTQWAIEKNDGSGNALTIAVPALFPPQPSLPHVLDAGSSVSFLVLASQVAAEFRGSDPAAAQPVIYLATGQVAKGKRGQITFD
ncbi:hypothetical protein [Microbacterium sp.]|uniref:hypothetical protein n=1 Tax=Microbacterium sp. TaxID=51671 RepID=UPI0035687AE8